MLRTTTIIRFYHEGLCEKLTRLDQLLVSYTRQIDKTFFVTLSFLLDLKFLVDLPVLRIKNFGLTIVKKRIRKMVTKKSKML